jgi:hypothetical protein
MSAPIVKGRTILEGWVGAGLEVLSVTQSADESGLQGRIYRVRYDCCGAEMDLKYESLTRRIYKYNHGDATRCQSCTRSDNARAVRAVQVRTSKYIGKYALMRAPALRMASKGTVPLSDIDDWLDLPRGTTARWMKESDKPQPKKTDVYRIADPVKVLALSGAWR